MYFSYLFLLAICFSTVNWIKGSHCDSPIFLTFLLPYFSVTCFSKVNVFCHYFFPYVAFPFLNGFIRVQACVTLFLLMSTSHTKDMSSVILEIPDVVQQEWTEVCYIHFDSCCLFFLLQRLLFGKICCDFLFRVCFCDGMLFFKLPK